jgi:hypothetical protein
VANGTVALPRTLGRRLGALPMVIGGALVFVIGYGLNHSWKATLGPVLDKIGGVSIPTGLFGSIHPLGWLRTANHQLEAWFSDAQRYGEKGMVWGFTNFATFWVLIGATAFLLGQAVFQLGEWTTDYVRKALHAAHLSRVVPRLDLAIDAAKRYTNHAIARVNARVDYLAHRIAHFTAVAGADIATLPARVGSTPNQLRRLWRSLRGIRSEIVGLGAVALVTAALVSMGFRWVKCSQAKSLGRKLNCWHFGLLNDLFALAFDAWLVTDLCRIVHAMTSAAQLFAKEIEYLSGQISGLIQCQGASRPHALTVEWHDPPAPSAWAET